MSRTATARPTAGPAEPRAHRGPCLWPPDLSHVATWLLPRMARAWREAAQLDQLTGQEMRAERRESLARAAEAEHRARQAAPKPGYATRVVLARDALAGCA